MSCNSLWQSYEYTRRRQRRCGRVHLVPFHIICNWSWYMKQTAKESRWRETYRKKNWIDSFVDEYANGLAASQRCNNNYNNWFNFIHYLVISTYLHSIRLRNWHRVSVSRAPEYPLFGIVLIVSFVFNFQLNLDIPSTSKVYFRCGVEIAISNGLHSSLQSICNIVCIWDLSVNSAFNCLRFSLGDSCKGKRNDGQRPSNANIARWTDSQ